MLRRLLLKALVLCQLCLLAPAVAHAKGGIFIDSAGRTVQLPDHVGRVLAAGPPASVLALSALGWSWSCQVQRGLCGWVGGTAGSADGLAQSSWRAPSWVWRYGGW